MAIIRPLFDNGCGRIIQVDNLKRKPGEAAYYFAITVEDELGTNRRILLFAASELKRCPNIYLPSDIYPGRLYRYEDNQFKGYTVKLQVWDETSEVWEVIVKRISRRRLQIAENRANKTIAEYESDQRFQVPY